MTQRIRTQDLEFQEINIRVSGIHLKIMTGISDTSGPKLRVRVDEGSLTVSDGKVAMDLLVLLRRV